MKLHHFAVTCSTMEHAEKFYHDILGLEKVKDTPLDGALSEKIFGIAMSCRLLLYSNQKMAVEIFVLTDPPLKTPSFDHVCLNVHDRKAFVEKCKAAGCEINIIPKGDAFLSFLKDFDGNLFEIKEEQN